MLSSRVRSTHKGAHIRAKSSGAAHRRREGALLVCGESLWFNSSYDRVHGTVSPWKNGYSYDPCVYRMEAFPGSPFRQTASVGLVQSPVSPKSVFLPRVSSGPRCRWKS
ncbi:unnamed protein product [Hapterophycus canaliculatus]